MEGFDFYALLKKHEKKHKAKPAQFTSVASGVSKRLENHLRKRKSSRLSTFDKIRKLSDCTVHDVPTKSVVQEKVEHRRQQLEKWKEEKEKQKKEAAAHKKKPFLAGIPQAPLKFVPPPPLRPSSSGRVTRSQTARNNASRAKTNTHDSKAQSFAPKNASFKPPQIKNVTKVPPLATVTSKTEKKPAKYTFNPILPKQIKQTRSNINKMYNEATNKVDLKSRGKVTKAKTPVSPVQITSSSSSEDQNSLGSFQSSNDEMSQEKCPIVKKKSTRKSTQDLCFSPILGSKTPIKGSNEITPKRAIPKSESSSEEKLRSPKSPVDAPMTPEQITEEAKKISPCVTLSRGKDNARKEMKKKMEEGLFEEDASDIYSISHFRKQLDSEIKRMTEMCETWDRISEQTVLPDAVQEAVLGAVGQARLLMSQKLQQFSSLVDRCARPEAGGALVTPADLHGFWDMVFMQVENVDMRFKKLEELRARGWVEEQPREAAPRPARRARVTRPAGASRIKDMIAAARKAKKQQEDATQQATAGTKTFEAGFFCVRSPLRSPAPATPRRSSLLKAVLSSEAKKASASKNSASFAMLRASVMGKEVECEGIAPLPQTPMTPINIYATPGRSILKSTKKSGKKSIKVVLFDQCDHNTPEIYSQEADKLQLSMDIVKDGDSNKENTRKSKLVKQDEMEERSPVMTRSRRKSVQTPAEDTVKRSSRKQTLQEADNVIITPKRSSGRRKRGKTGVTEVD